MRAHPGLDYAHRHWALPDRPVPGTGRKDALRARLARFIFGVLGPYLHAERELLANLVRLADGLAARCDELAAEVEQLRCQLDERAVAVAANHAELAERLDQLRRLAGAPLDA